MIVLAPDSTIATVSKRAVNGRASLPCVTDSPHLASNHPIQARRIDSRYAISYYHCACKNLMPDRIEPYG